MLDVIALNVGGVPITFWAAMGALLMAMFCMARAKLNDPAVNDDEAFQIPAQEDQR